MTSAYENSHLRDEAASPRSRSKVTMQTHEPLAPQPPRSLRESLEAMDMRTDPDVQATVTDFLDFTEHLSSDMIRSLTLIGQLDESYTDFSKTVNKLTTQWSQLPDLTGVVKPSPEGLREAISQQLRLAMRSRIHAHAEAIRMSDNVNRHYNRAATLLAKLKTMLENFPTAEELEKSPVMYKAIIVPKKITKNDQKQKRNRPPKIIIPGEVLAPYELDDDSMSDDSSESSSEEEPEPVIRRPLNLPAPKHKSGSRLGRPPKVTGLLATTTPAIAAAAAAAMGLPKPPPANAPPGSADAPWLRLTPFELAKLRKRMKKNATWNPSETMIARELNNLGRGPEAYKAAKQKALEEGREFEEVIPPSAQPDTGAPAVVPEGALTAEALADSSLSASNKGMKLNEAKKLKREAMAKMAAEEAEASERKFEEIAKMLLQTTPGPDASKVAKSAPRSAIKRKRGGGDDETGYGSDAGREAPLALATATSLDTSTTAPATSVPTTNAPSATSVPPNPANTSRGTIKRIKVETPILPPKISINTESKPPSGAAGPNHTTSSSVSTQPTHQSTTPVPLPPHVTAQVSIEGVSGTTLSVSPSRTGTPGPTRKASVEPVPNVRKSTTPILPPTRDTPRRETRGESAKKQAGAASPVIRGPSGDIAPTVETQPSRRSSSRNSTPRSTPAPDAATTTTTGSRRPGSRSNSAAEPSLTVLTNERPRRTSAARVTPQPGDKSPPSTGATGAGTAIASQRAKRPANTTSSGDNSAVGKRKAATRKKARAPKKDKSASNVPPTTPTGTSSGDAEVDEFDEDGTPIDPNEPRYCLCNRVSFGTMIACENDECRFQWFHLGCVDLKEIPRRTTKWYCPDCRKRLNIGEKGQVTSRGIRT